MHLLAAQIISTQMQLEAKAEPQPQSPVQTTVDTTYSVLDAPPPVE
jgi:hypothetical protein